LGQSVAIWHQEVFDIIVKAEVLMLNTSQDFRSANADIYLIATKLLETIKLSSVIEISWKKKYAINVQYVWILPYIPQTSIE